MVTLANINKLKTRDARIERLIYYVFEYDNDPVMDKKPCERCHCVPPIYMLHEISRRNKLHTTIFRRNRVDYVDDDGITHTLCRKCWKKEVGGWQETDPYNQVMYEQFRE